VPTALTIMANFFGWIKETLSMKMSPFDLPKRPKKPLQSNGKQKQEKMKGKIGEQGEKLHKFTLNFSVIFYISMYNTSE